MNVDLVVLGLLARHDMHGYQLKKELDALLGGNASFGSIYPALRRLKREGAVVEADVAVALPAPDPSTAAAAATGLTGVRAMRRAALRQRMHVPDKAAGRRKTYSITLPGHALLHALLLDPEGVQGHDFGVRLALASAAGADVRSELVACRTEYLRAVDRRLTATTTDASVAVAFDYERALARAEMAWLEAIDLPPKGIPSETWSQTA